MNAKSTKSLWDSCQYDRNVNGLQPFTPEISSPAYPQFCDPLSDSLSHSCDTLTSQYVSQDYVSQDIDSDGVSQFNPNNLNPINPVSPNNPAQLRPAQENLTQVNPTQVNPTQVNPTQVNPTLADPIVPPNLPDRQDLLNRAIQPLPNDDLQIPQIWADIESELEQTPGLDQLSALESTADTDPTQLLAGLIALELEAALQVGGTGVERVTQRIAKEVDRICQKSDRIQTSGEVSTWRVTLARYRLQKCIYYYRLGSQRGRLELHSNLSTMVYRPIAPAHLNLNFQARYSLIEDFLQGFYTESLRALRRENDLAENFQPRTRLELAEYLTFTEQYAKRRISLPNRQNQQLLILRAQRFAARQPQEIAIDIEQAIESNKAEQSESYGQSPILQLIREQLVQDSSQSTDTVLRDRVVTALSDYLKRQKQEDCLDYLALKLQDLSVAEIDEILGLKPRQRDYLQQRFKYHIEKFITSEDWQLVHEWLGADLGQNLGLSERDWGLFLADLSDSQRQLLRLKQMEVSDEEICQTLKCTPKQLQKAWSKLLDRSRQMRGRSFN